MPSKPLPEANPSPPNAQGLRLYAATLAAAWVFYTSIPLPSMWPLQFRGIARWAWTIGLLLGGGLALFNVGLIGLQVPPLTRAALVVAVWLWLTGGLHLDGAMDSADGLAVQEPERRLEVMADSRSGAFAVMTAILLLLLKTVALSELTLSPALALMAALAWGRWAQLGAIVLYPYLKPTGKGAFHKADITSAWAMLPPWLALTSLTLLYGCWQPTQWRAVLLILGVAPLLGLLVGYSFYRWFGGHTGDTYGAVVEWTEALLLVCLTCLR